MTADHCGTFIMVRGHTGVQSNKMGLYILNGHHNGNWKWKSSFEYKGKSLFLYCSSTGFWKVNEELNDSGPISSVKAGGPTPLDLSWKLKMVNRWIEDSALEVVSMMDILVFSGHNGIHRKLMGHYAVDGHHNGFPKWVFNFRENWSAILNRGKKFWYVSSKCKNAGWIKSVEQCDDIPVGLQWKVWADKKWTNDSQLEVRALDTWLGRGSIKQLCVRGQVGSRKLLRRYDLDGQYNGYPKWKSTRSSDIGPSYIYRDKTTHWLENAEVNEEGRISSCSMGASLPIGLAWQLWDKGTQKWVPDPELIVTQMESQDHEEKVPAPELVFMHEEKKEAESKPLLSSLKMWSKSSKKMQKENVATRVRNRWGDGLEDPTSGKKAFFPAAWKPSQGVDKSLLAMSLTEEEVKHVMLEGARRQKEAKEFEISVSADSAAAVYAYTMEWPDVYTKLNSACRKKGRRAKLQLDRYRDYLYHLQSASSTMPNFVGRTYRGISVRLAPNKYPIGEVITWHQMSSTTGKMTATLPFLGKTANGGLQGTIFVIDVKAGKDIEIFSAFPSEDEVLMALNSFFLVESKINSDKKKEVLGDLSAYNMEQLDVYILKQI